jgi:hypothetical protein
METDDSICFKRSNVILFSLQLDKFSRETAAPVGLQGTNVLMFSPELEAQSRETAALFALPELKVLSTTTEETLSRNGGPIYFTRINNLLLFP